MDKISLRLVSDKFPLSLIIDCHSWMDGSLCSIWVLCVL